MSEYVYLLITRESIRMKDNVFKIGRTKNIKNRLRHYPKGTELINVIKVNDAVFVEQEIMRGFKEKFINRTDFGTEYFEGDINEIKFYFCEIVNFNKDEIKCKRFFKNHNTIKIFQEENTPTLNNTDSNYHFNLHSKETQKNALSTTDVKESPSIVRVLGMFKNHLKVESQRNHELFQFMAHHMKLTT